MAEEIVKKTRKDVLITYWNGHLIELVRLEILIERYEKLDPKKVIKQEPRMISNMQVMKDITAGEELEGLRAQLEDQKAYLEVIKEKLKKEENENR